MAMSRDVTDKRYFSLSNKAAFAARFFVFLAMAISLAAVHLAAQNTSGGEIRGVVLDTSGAAIPGAAITVTNTATSVITNLTSNDTGVYDAVSLTPGTYTITFARAASRSLSRATLICPWKQSR